MERIPNDLFTSILSYLPNQSIAALITNHNLDKAIKESAKTNIFWKQRVEILLGRYLDEQNLSFTGLRRIYSDWKLIYKNLIEDFRGTVDLNKFGSAALIAASEKGHYEVVKLLLADNRVDPSAKNNYAIIAASNYGNTKVVKLLLADNRVDPSTCDNASIILASEYDHPEVVRLLLTNNKVDPSADNNLAITLASANANDLYEVVKLLLNDDRVDSSADNNLAITRASERGNYEVVKLLLAEGKINIITKMRAIFVIIKSYKKSVPPVFDVKRIIYLAGQSLKDLIKRGNNSEYDREIILLKFFWWFRLDKLHGITNSKSKDPFAKSLLLESS